jgi:hypothetical protein
LDTGLTPLITTSNYCATSNIHISQIIIAPAKHFPACCIFNSRSLATASNSGDSSASRAQVLPSPTLVQNSQPAIPSNELDRHLFSASIAQFNCTQRSNLFQSSSQLAWDARYEASGRIPQKTPFPTFCLLLLAYSFVAGIR